MKKENKGIIIENLAAMVKEKPNFYIADATGLNAEQTAKLRRECFKNGIKLVVAKNTLLRKALESLDLNGVTDIFPALKGTTAVMFTEVVNAPAKLIKSFGKENNGKPALKGAYVQENIYLGENQLETLVNIKSREELIGDIIGLILSPGQRLVSAINSIAEKEENAESNE